MRQVDKLIRWLEGTNRRYIILKSRDLVDALDKVGAVEQFQQIVMLYAQHRGAEPDPDRTEPERDGQGSVTVYKTDSLTVAELDQCIRQLAREITDMDPTWKL